MTSQPTLRNRGLTLLEVMIVLVVFSTMMAATLMTLNTSSTVQKSQQLQSAMQNSSRLILNDIKKHLGEAELSPNEIDTRMRWLNVYDGKWETYDKFHTWVYTRDSDSQSYYPALAQCPETFCGWVWDGSTPHRKHIKFTANYNYRDGSGDPLFYFDFYDSSASSYTGKWFSLSGRVYNSLYSPDEHSQNGVNPYVSGYEHTTAQCIKGNGARLSPLVQVDVLQFPTPRNVKGQYITNEGKGRDPDSQGWLIYAPSYDKAAERLEMRRFGLFVSDLFETHPWSGTSNPLYASPVNATDTIDSDVIDAADNAVSIQTSDYITGYGTYNKIEEDGSTGDRPPDWPETDSGNDNPALKHFFDFNGNNLIETDVDSDGNDKITYGTTRAESESTIESFRLYPSTSTISPSNRFADWTSASDINNVNGLVYHKYSDRNLRISSGAEKYHEMEVYYFIDLDTGWTRFYYYCSWDKSNSGTDWYSINASFIREKFDTMNQDFISKFYIPYTEFGRGFIGMDFSTYKTYPDKITSGISSDANAVRIGFMMDEKMLQNGQFRFPSFRQETMVPLSP